MLRTVAIEAFTVTLLFVTIACNTNSSQSVHAANTSPDPSSNSAVANAASFAFSESDVEAYEKGLAQEIALVRAARERGNQAKTAAARAAAAQDEWEEQTIPGGAQLSGLSIERYRKVRKAVNHVLETLDYQGKINGPLELDLEHATPEMKQRLNSDAFTELSPASAAALRSRMSRLVPVWVQYMELTALNG